MSIPPPHGMSEVDYEAIEAAVTETVRGRWFLAEFARRNRVAETRQLLDAMARLESAVVSGQAALPSADPSIRLLVQRIKEIATRLGDVAGAMRVAGVDERFTDAVEAEGRAVSGMMRTATPALAGKGAAESSPVPRADGPPALTSKPPAPSTKGDPRLAALAVLDELPLAEKLALFR